MTLDDIDAFATSLQGCKRKGRPGRVAWYVDDRLVVRQDEPGTVMVQADLDGDRGAICEAVRLAWVVQRRG